MTATPSRRAEAGSGRRTASPSSSIVPASGSISPARTFARVDLPAPFSPQRARISPRRTSRETPRTARMPPYDLAMPDSRRRIGAGSVIGRDSYPESTQTDGGTRGRLGRSATAPPLVAWLLPGALARIVLLDVG